MLVTTRQSNREVHISLDGELDQSVAESVRKKMDTYLDKVSVDTVVFDMRRLQFMDSTGIGLILGRYKKLRAKNISVYIENPNRQIDKILKIAGLYTIIPLLR